MLHKHLMDESEDETQYPLSEENWMKQVNGNSSSMSFTIDIL